MMCPITGILALRSGGSFGSNVGTESFVIPKTTRVIEMTTTVIDSRLYSTVSRISARRWALLARLLFDTSMALRMPRPSNEKGRQERK